MTIRNLDKMLSPKSVAFFGAGEKDGTIGKTVVQNLLGGGFTGPIWFINPHHQEVSGHPCYPDLKSLPDTPDLAIIATPPSTVPGIIADLGKKGTRACVVITAGIGENHNLKQKMLDAACPYNLRIMGTNCFGLMVPGIGLNASFSHLTPGKGNIAFISQSGAVIAAVVDWAADQNVGFSHIASLGNMDDVDVGDMLDCLAMDHQSAAIMMYLEQVTNPRKFMSAARAASRIKPVIVIKAGRHVEGAKAASSHTGAMMGADDIYDAAFHRAGLLRVIELEDMFDASEILAHSLHPAGNRLAIMSNGGGAGVLAVDRLIDLGGTPAALEPETIRKLGEVLPAGWSKSNPVDLFGDAGPDRYAVALDILAQDKNTDAILVIHCPTALTSRTDVALTINKMIRKVKKNKTVLAAWLGGDAAQLGRNILSSENIPVYETPEDAIRGFSYLTKYHDLQKEIMLAPPSLPLDLDVDTKKVRDLMVKASKNGRTLLNELEAKEILACYGIATVPTRRAETPEDVRKIATAMLKDQDYELVIKILSNDISHKSDAGGVALNLPTPHAAENAAKKMLAHIKMTYPEAVISGFTVQPMIQRKGSLELILGIGKDKTFGPTILFGQGGTATEIIKDRAVDLVPLDSRLAMRLIKKTRIYKLLEGYRDQHAVNIDAIALTLVRLSQMAIECPELQELDINPLLVDQKGVIALDARIVVQSIKDEGMNPHARLAIRPYPKQWEKKETLSKGDRILIRPIRPEDEKYFAPFMEKMEPDDVRQRFFSPLKTLSSDFVSYLTQIDYARSMAFVAIDPEKDEMLGVSRLCADPDNIRAEYAALVRSDKKNRGIGWAIMNRLIEYAKTEDIKELWGEVMSDNTSFLKMCTEFGFLLKMDKFDPYIINTTLKLDNVEERQSNRKLS